MRITRTLLPLLAAALLWGCTTSAPTPAPVRLVALNCGEIQIPDISPWSPGFNAGKAMTFSNNCYLIHHGKTWMLWDSGFSDALAANPDGQAGPMNMRMKRSVTLVSQLAAVGVKPEQITAIAFSHSHADHVGNANLFANATLYMQQAEYDLAFGPEPAKSGFNPALYDKLRHNPMVKLSGDKDVFGDGSVVILSTPGHTAGHQSLLVRLPKAGAVVLSGDLAHFRENFELRRVPRFNFSAEQSQASMERVARLLQSERAQLWINHDSAQNATLPHAPKFVE
ncbi:MAG: N-acyl homoserine lactonase family protein [Ideonella sp.]|nr:N-acyl homoserine lactonase family protein [Ideonella sp.]MCC7457692.1 N-acyl homoserine lactonase family protein [Nitrospira sp.]